MKVSNKKVSNFNIKHFVATNYKSILYLGIIAICCAIKLVLCSVSIDGSQIFKEMTADYWNIGKDILNGKVLYRDVIDHKGLYLYLFYALFVWLSNNHIVVIVFAETLLLMATIGSFYYFVVKDGQSSFGKEMYKKALFPTVIFACFYTILTDQVTLVNTEGFVLPVAILVYGYAKNTNKIEPKHFAIIGILLGILFNFKITSIALFVPVYVLILARHLKNKGNVKQVAKATAVGIATFVATNTPFLLYLLKNEVLENFLTIYNHCLSKKESLDILTILIPFLLLCFGIACLYKEKEDLCNAMVVLSMISAYANFGTFLSYYTALYIGMLFCIVIKHGEINKVSYFVVIGIAFVFEMIAIKSHRNLMFASSQQEIAKKYGIHNDNILYLWEDWGFGAYENESFVEPYQWVPTMMLYSEDFKEEYISLSQKRLEEKQFKYVFSLTKEGYEYAKNMIENSSEEHHDLEVLLSLESSLLENYEPLEDAPFLYIAKQP